MNPLINVGSVVEDPNLRNLIPLPPTSIQRDLPPVSLDLVGQIFRGPKGDKGDPGVDSDKHYNHTQNLPDTIWAINHNLGKYPSVTVADSSGSEVEGEVVHIDSNTVVITFSAAFSGKAYLN